MGEKKKITSDIIFFQIELTSIFGKLEHSAMKMEV